MTNSETTRVFEFDSQITLGDEVPDFDTNIIKNEPMLFSCSQKAARELGGPITREFLRHLSLEFLWRNDLIIDSRVHMLMENWWPCIPGFHCDDVPRTLPDNQPNHFDPSYKSNHAMFLINGDICPTEFAIGQGKLEDIKEGKYYKEWHPQILQMLRAGTLQSLSAPSNKIIYFNWQSWHQGTKAVRAGWRFFIRASINTERKPTNEVRRQVQVYMENPVEGW